MKLEKDKWYSISLDNEKTFWFIKFNGTKDGRKNYHSKGMHYYPSEYSRNWITRSSGYIEAKNGAEFKECNYNEMQIIYGYFPEEKPECNSITYEIY